MDRQLHPGILALESSHRLRQGVARLGMGGGDPERAGGLVRKLLAGALEIGGLRQDALGDAEYRSAGFCHRHHALAVALEDLDAQLVFEQLDLLAHAGLGSMQGLRSGRDVESTPGDFDDITQLLELHARL